MKDPNFLRSAIPARHVCVKLRDQAWFNSGIRIKHDRTCQRSINIISIEKTFALYKSAEEKTFFPGIFF